MARPIYPYELDDPDFTWLINNFLDQHPEYISVESTCLPVVFISEPEERFEQETFIVATETEQRAPAGGKQKLP